MTRAEMEQIAAMSTEEYARWLTRTQHGMFRAAAARQQDVPRTVTAMHERQRNVEPPRPYSKALETRSATAGAPQAAPRVLRDADGTPLPWSSALAARRAAEGQ